MNTYRPPPITVHEVHLVHVAEGIHPRTTIPDMHMALLALHSRGIVWHWETDPAMEALGYRTALKLVIQRSPSHVS